jgi:acyl carrier protein
MPAGDSVTDQVFDAIARVKNLPRETVSEEQLLTELGFDSLDTINLLFELEERFQISIPDEDARKIRSVGDIVTGIRTLSAQSAGNTRDSAA